MSTACIKCHHALPKLNLWDIRLGSQHCLSCGHGKPVPDQVEALCQYIRDLEDHFGTRLANLESLRENNK